MDEGSDQILDHIEAQRDELGRNLHELEERVRRTADWRTHFDRNPILVLGAALGGGLLLGSVVAGQHNHRSAARPGSTKHWRGGSQERASSSFAPAASGVSQTAEAVKPSTGSPVARVSAGHANLSQVSQALDQVKAALIAFGITKMKEFMSEAIPGLDQHLKQAEMRGQKSTGSSRSSDYRAGTQGFSSPVSTSSREEFAGSGAGRGPIADT